MPPAEGDVERAEAIVRSHRHSISRPAYAGPYRGARKRRNAHRRYYRAEARLIEVRIAHPRGGDPCPKCGETLANCSPSGQGVAACDTCQTWWPGEQDT